VFVPPEGGQVWIAPEADASALEGPRPGASRKLGFLVFLGVPVLVVLGWMRCRLALQMGRERAAGSAREPGPDRE